MNPEIEYKDFRTGLTFKKVRQMLQLEADRKYEQGVYMFITRATVLGRWREIKQEMYNDEYKIIEIKNEKLPNFIFKEY